MKGRNALAELSSNRRDFLKVSTAVAATLGFSTSMIPKVAEALENPTKPPVIWLHFQECTGCTETLLRTEGPDLASVILDVISLEYHETLFAAAGHQMEKQLHDAMERYAGKYVLVVEGAIPLKENGRYCEIAGKTAVSMLTEVASKAAALIAIGSCASWGGIPSAGPNPTGAVPVNEIIKDKPVVTIPGCPPNPHNFLSTVVHFLVLGKLPALDDKGRPKFAYGKTIHDQCERRAHFNSGRFVKRFGDEAHRKGHCLFELGCKGPMTWGNCPEIGFNREKTWPVSVGHPCFGCIEKDVGFSRSLHDKSDVLFPNPPQIYAQIDDPKNKDLSGAAIGIAGAVVGAGATAVVLKTMNLPDKED
ncbi:MAG: hydrogenase small subunit [SAR324 cluster bacterium]|nr:hydrogenase small subunit [SAR324 cluster bacterium]